MSTSSSSREKSADILLVDGTRHGSVARKTLLQEQGHHITIATSGEDALEAFSHHPFDVVVTDLKMPKMNGIELIRQVRKVKPEVSIILLHSLTDGLGLDERSSGADTVVSKGPNEVTHLLRAVSRLVNRPARRPPASHRNSSRGKARGA